MRIEISRSPRNVLSVVDQPLAVGTIQFPNRISISAHSYNFVSNGVPTKALTDYVVARARGGVGSIILGETQVSRWPAGDEGMWGSYASTNELIEFETNLMTKVREVSNTRILEQLSHPGGQVWPGYNASALAPSAIVHDVAGLVPREMTGQEIKHMVQLFSAAAKRAVLAGLDGVEIKCDQGKLIHQFLSREYNLRTDEWGGFEVSHRAKFLFAVLEAVRNESPPSFALGVRVCGDANGSESARSNDITLSETCELIAQLESRGLADYVSLSGATNSDARSYRLSHGDAEIRRNTFAVQSRVLKQHTNLPVIVAGKVDNLYDAADVISSGAADGVSMTRAHIAEPEILAKFRANRMHEIRPCVHCNQNCAGNTWEGLPVGCIHNPEAGREGVGPVVKLRSSLATPRPVVRVIGAGVAGLEAARTASEYGFEVALYERTSLLGGQIRHAALSPGRHGMVRIATHLAQLVQRSSNVKVAIGCDVGETEIARFGEDDMVIVATGASFPAKQQSDTTTSRISIVDALSEPEMLVGSILVLDEDWHMHALGAAVIAKRRGATVSIASRQEFVGKYLDLPSLSRYMTELDHPSVSLYPFHALSEPLGTRVSLRNTLSGSTVDLGDVDLIVDAKSPTPNLALSRQVQSMVALERWISIGDCNFPRGADVAISEAHFRTRELLDRWA